MTSERLILYENLRACSYTPFYLALLTEGFRAEGLDVDLRLSPSTPETAKGLISGRADVSFGGPMRVMMHHDNAHSRGETSSLVCFGQVVARDPFILVGRERNPDFQFKDLVGPKVAVAVDVPTPWMTLWDDLDRAGIDPVSINRTPDAPMKDNMAALARGEIDVLQVFEPYAELAVTSGNGHIWHRFSTRGEIAFTTFYTTRRFATDRRLACQALVRAIAGALDGMREMPAAEIASLVGPEFFPELPLEAYTRIIENYRNANLWARSPALPVAAYTRLKAALLAGGLIAYDVPYESAVDKDLSLPTGNPA